LGPQKKIRTVIRGFGKWDAILGEVGPWTTTSHWKKSISPQKNQTVKKVGGEGMSDAKDRMEETH